MNRLTGISVVILVLSSAWARAAETTDLKAYYEQQKAEIIADFVAPPLGSEATIQLAAGQSRTGILMKLDDKALSLMTDSGMVTYKRAMLHESSRAHFFAVDFAEAKALEKVRERKDQLRRESLDEDAANMHEGSISVVAKVEKTSDKNIEKEERENERSGNSLTITTTTRTYTEIQNLQITVANIATHPDTFVLEWYFFGKSPVDDDITPHDKGSRRVAVGARQRTRENVSSEAYVIEKVARNMESSDSNSNRDAQESESGKENAGWLVLLKHGNEVLDMKASLKTYMDEEWLSNLR